MHAQGCQGARSACWPSVGPGIIAHVDHGKSTLADRLLEATGAIAAGGQAQYLDKLQASRQQPRPGG